MDPYTSAPGSLLNRMVVPHSHLIRTAVQKEVRMVFSRKTGIRTEVQIISLRKKGHLKRGSDGG